MSAPELLSEREAAALLRVGVSTLRRWRTEGTGPPWYRIGRVIRYRRDELLAWLEDQRGG